MKRLIQISILCLAVVALFGVYHRVSAQGNSAQTSSSPATKSARQAIALGGSHILKSTKINYDNALVALGTGFQPLDDPTTVVCPGLGGSCVIGAEQNVQINDTQIGNRWAICTAIDGSFLSTPFCPYQGYTDPGGNQYVYSVGSFAQQASGYLPGTHTVQTFLYSDLGISRSIYTIIYRVYKP